MPGARLRALIAGLLVPGVRCNAAESKPFIECDRVELVQAVPEPAGIQFEPSEDRVNGMLQATVDRLQGMFAKLPFAALRSVERMQDLEPILRLPANSNIPVYTIDSRGLYSSGS